MILFGIEVTGKTKFDNLSFNKNIKKYDKPDFVPYLSLFDLPEHSKPRHINTTS